MDVAAKIIIIYIIIYIMASTWQHASAGILLLEDTKYVTESS